MHLKVILLTSLVLVIACTAPCIEAGTKNSRRRKTQYNTSPKHLNNDHHNEVNHHADRSDHRNHDAHNSNVRQSHVHNSKNNNRAAPTNNVQHQRKHSSEIDDFAEGFVAGLEAVQRRLRHRTTTIAPRTTTTTLSPCSNYPSMPNTNQQEQQASPNVNCTSTNTPTNISATASTITSTSTSTNVPLQDFSEYISTTGTPLQSFNEDIQIGTSF